MMMYLHSLLIPLPSKGEEKLGHGVQEMILPGSGVSPPPDRVGETLVVSRRIVAV